MSRSLEEAQSLYSNRNKTRTKTYPLCYPGIYDERSWANGSWVGWTCAREPGARSLRRRPRPPGRRHVIRGVETVLVAAPTLTPTAAAGKMAAAGS